MADKTPEGEEVYPDEEQGIEPEKTSEEKELGMETGENEEEVYDEEGREKLTEDGEIEPWEEGFMEGAAGKGKAGHCAVCGKPLSDEHEGVIEKEIDGKKVTYCSEECAEKGAKE